MTDSGDENGFSIEGDKGSSLLRMILLFYFDSESPLENVSWVQMDSSVDTWTLFVDGSLVPETQKQEWDVVFSSVSKLMERNTQTGK